MGYIRVKRPTTGGEAVPDNALLFYNADTNEYYLLIDSLGNYLTWSSA
jgi:hypothetical protein